MNKLHLTNTIAREVVAVHLPERIVHRFTTGTSSPQTLVYVYCDGVLTDTACIVDAHIISADSGVMPGRKA